MTVRSASRAEVRRLAALARGRERREAGACLVEGHRVLREALGAGARVRLVAAAPELDADERTVVDAARDAGARIVAVDARDAERIAHRLHGPALFAEVALPDAWEEQVPGTGPVLVVLLAGIQDPGNVGTLIRSARAFGACAVLTTPGCADPFGPKALRASAGAAFGVGWVSLETEQAAALASRHALTPRLATPPGRDGGTAASAADLESRVLLVLGHETRGVPSWPGARAVTVPQHARVESLNVAAAGAVLMAGWFAGHATR